MDKVIQQEYVCVNEGWLYPRVNVADTGRVRRTSRLEKWCGLRVNRASEYTFSNLRVSRYPITKIANPRFYKRNYSVYLVASPTSQLILQPFFRFSYVTGTSLVTWRVAHGSKMVPPLYQHRISSYFSIFVKLLPEIIIPLTVLIIKKNECLQILYQSRNTKKDDFLRVETWKVPRVFKIRGYMKLPYGLIQGWRDHLLDYLFLQILCWIDTQ